MYDLNIVHIIFFIFSEPKSSSDYMYNVRLRVSGGYDKMRPCKMVNSIFKGFFGHVRVVLNIFSLI